MSTENLSEARAELATVYLERQVLPAAGAYTEATPVEILRGASELSLVMLYVKSEGATAGAYVARLWWYFAVDDTVPVGQVLPDVNGATIADPTATVLGPQLVIQGEAVAGDDPVSRCWVFHVPPGAARVRVDVAEVGDTDFPGAIEARIVTRTP
jgi:hypothetical protein